MGPTDGASGALTVLYDENCGFCAAIASRFVRAARGRLRAEPIGSPLGADALRDLARRDRYASVHVVDERGRRWSGAAVCRVCHVLRSRVLCPRRPSSRESSLRCRVTQA